MHSILLVEDDDSIRDTVKDVLVEEGYRVRAVSSIGEARAALAAETPDCVLLDFHLPDGTAEELLTELDGASTTTTSVLMSASPSAPPVATRFAIALVSKPFDLDALLAAVRMAALRSSSTP